MSAQLHTGDVVASISIAGLLNKREGVIKLLRHAVDTLAEAQRMTTEGGMLTDTYRQFGWVVDGPSRHHENTLLSEESLKDVIVRLDSALWGKLMYDSGLLTFMDSKARAEFAEKIDKCQTPPLTAENIEATFAAMYAGRDDMFDRGVIACFKSLSWCYQTNNPVKFGKRIIKEYLCEKWGGMNYRALDSLNDLQRVFRVVDGKPEEDHRNCLGQRLRVAHGHGVATGEHVDDYMAVKWFKNGNGHITFTRPDLVDRLNSIIAKHYPGALPEARS
jgi:uncharacterized protein DUF4942